MLTKKLCIDFRDRLLVVLSSTCQSDFTEAKKIVEERLRDILDTTSSLSSAEIALNGPNTGRSLCSSVAPEEHVSSVSIDVEFDQPMLDCSQSTPSVTGSAEPAQYQDFDDTNQMTVEDPACVDLFAAETQNTGHISGSCLQDLSFGVVSMNSPTLIDWSARDSNFPSTQEYENQFPEYITFFEGEPNFDDWLSNMTWSSPESHSSPSDGHLAGDTLQFNHVRQNPNNQVAKSVTSVSSSDTNSRSTRSMNSGFSGQTPSSQSSAPESCSDIQEPASANCLQRAPREPVSRRTTNVTPRDQKIRPRARRPTSRLTGGCNMDVGGNEARGRQCMPLSRNVRRMDTEASTILSDLSVEYALARFSNTEEVFETFRERLSEDRKHLSSLLMRLFYAVGSPDALRQLREALDLARKNCMVPAYHAANDLATTVSVLDQLDATTTLSHILRRYHLVRLLDHRSKLESNHKAAKLAAKGTKRRLKYDCAMIEIMKRGAEADFDANTRSAKDNQLKYRSKTQALNDLMRTLYPDLQPDSEGSTTAAGCEYNRKLTKLRNRLSCARNWYQFEQEFPGAILALIPCAAGDLSISIDQ